MLALMFVALSIGFARAETLSYGSRAGMEVTVVSKEGLGTPLAKIVTKHTKANATAFCREYVGKVTPKCVAEEMKSQLIPIIEANCQTGKFTTIAGGRYHFAGVNNRYDPTEGTSPKFIIYQVGEKEPLEAFSATGYDVALDQFKALCPNRFR